MVAILQAAGATFQRVERLAHRGLDSLTEHLGGPARRRVIVILAAVLALNGADQGSIGAVAPQLEASLHVSDLGLGLLVTITSLVGAVATVPMGGLVDRVARVRLVAWAIVAWGVAEAVSGAAADYGMLVATRMALGAVTAVAAPVVASLSGDLFPPGERGRVYGVLITGEMLGTGFGVLVSGLVSGWFGWRPAVALLALPSAALWYFLVRHFPEPARGGQSWLRLGTEYIPATEEDPHGFGSAGSTREAQPIGRDEAPQDPEGTVLTEAARATGASPAEEIVVGDARDWTLWQALGYVLKVRTNVVLIVASSLGYFFFAGLKTYAVIFVRGHFQIDQGIATVLVLVVGAGAITGALGAGRLADRLIRSGHATARLEVAAVGLLAGAAVLVPIVMTDQLALAIPLLVIAGAAIAGPNATMDAARLDVVPAQLWGRAESLRTALRTLLEAFAPLLFGLTSAAFGGSNGGFAASAATKQSSQVPRSDVRGLGDAFLLMLVPLMASGVLVLLARRTYATDVVSAAESQERAGSAGAT